MIPLNVLVAFPYFSKPIFEYLKRQDKTRYRLMVDSGAFTAHMSGEPITMDDYCRFLDTIRCLAPFHAVQLDVIGDHDATLKNYELMRARGFDVLPVFTRGAPLELLEHLFTQSDYVLIGGVAVGESRQGYVKHLMPKIQGRKVHLLGFTNLDFVKLIRPFSIDSSALTAGGRYGRLSLYQGLGLMKILSIEECRKMRPIELYALGRPSGLTPKEMVHLLGDYAWKGGNEHLGEAAAMRWLCKYSYVALARDIERNLGTKSFQALTTLLEIKECFNAYELLCKLSPVS